MFYDVVGDKIFFMKFVHIADIHANKNRLEYCLNALGQIKEYISSHQCSKDNIPLLIAGDFWDNTITNTESSGFTKYLTAVKDIVRITDVYIVAGTPFHEPSGSSDVFRSIGCTVFTEPGHCHTSKYNIFAIPEPRKAEYSAKSTKELNEAILKGLRNNIDEIKELKKKYPAPINILLYHGEIRGAVYDNSMVVPDTTYAMPYDWLKELDMDYIACGHIHLPQQIEKAGNCYYAGSVYPVNSGEHHDAGFNVVEILEN